MYTIFFGRFYLDVLRNKRIVVKWGYAQGRKTKLLVATRHRSIESSPKINNDAYSATASFQL